MAYPVGIDFRILILILGKTLGEMSFNARVLTIYLIHLPIDVMAPRRKEKYKLPVPLPEGKILDDMEGNRWALGKMIGSGGFGLIYLGKV
jgi:hypothetical protein